MSLIGILSTVLAVGFTAGLAPGPTSTLVLTQTLRYGLREGAKVSIAPLLTDLPIMLITLFSVGHFNQLPHVFGVISFLGGLFLIFLGAEVFFASAPSLNMNGSPSGSLMKGVMTNLLNPAPYLFWATVGTPMLIGAFDFSPWAGVTAATLFLGMIVSGKFTIAILAQCSSGFLRGRGFTWLLRGLGIVMFIFAIYYFKDAGTRFGLF